MEDQPRWAIFNRLLCASPNCKELARFNFCIIYMHKKSGKLIATIHSITSCINHLEPIGNDIINTFYTYKASNEYAIETIQPRLRPDMPSWN